MRETELVLVAAVKVQAFQDGNITRHPETHFLDFVVDGRSVRQVIDGAEGLVTELCRPWLHVVPDSVDRLLGRLGADGLAENRVALLVCGVCGDLECGAVTAQLDVSQDLVSWSEFRWEGGVGEVMSIDLEHEFNGRIVFDRAGYGAALSSAIEHVKSMPYDELEHRGRAFLWPWQWGWRMPKTDTVE